MIYAIGDIHGESQALRDMLAKLPLEPSDLVIFLGDLINRGPDPFECVEQVIAFDRCRKVCLQGNHEEAIQTYLEYGDPTELESLGGESTLNSYRSRGYALQPGYLESLPKSHARFYAMAESWTLPFYIVDDYIFVHAGWNLEQPLERQNTHAWRWGRVIGFEHPVWPQTIVRGHTPLPKVTFADAKRTIHVDTGCGFHGRLSAVSLPDRTVYSSVPSSFDPQWFRKMQTVAFR